MNTILLTVGHGGKDSGAVANGIREKNVTLPTALACEDYLDINHSGFEIYLTRREDEFVSLNEQIRVARELGADLVVDIHYNSFYLKRAHGMETFIAKTQLTESNKRAQRKIHDAVADYMRTHDIHDRGMKRSRHYLIRHLGKSNIDAVLVEGLFLSNPREAGIIRREQVQKEVGYAIGRGIARHLELPEKSTEPHKWPTIPLPGLARTVGVEVDGEPTDLVGLLAEIGGSYRTYLPMLDVGELTGIEVTGHGDHIKVNTKGGT